jgi:hypothetical protein
MLWISRSPLGPHRTGEGCMHAYRLCTHIISKYVVDISLSNWATQNRWKEKKERKNYAGSKTLPASSKEKETLARSAVSLPHHLSYM